MPEAPEDRTFKGQSYGAETEQAQLRSASAVKPVQVPVNFPSAEAPPVEEEPEELPGPDESLEIEGLGNLGDMLFADPTEDYGVGAEGELPFTPAGPHGPPPEYQTLMRDPRVSDATRALISLVSRLQMLTGE